ncbi:MAG: adenylyl-sulfate kinase [Nitrospirae bacterium]|nr:adenylyl-sulfate kinase [Nitrospirota bacterium]
MTPLAIWLTGIPGSGKSTLAEEIGRRHPDFVVLRMDEFRKILTPEPTYSEEERDMAYRCIVYTAACLVENGHSVLIDATGHLRKWRDLARQLIPKYGEVYLRCPIELCMQRERERSETHGAPKEIYKKGEAGWPVPGISAPYEAPLNPELLIEADRTFIPEAVQRIEELIAQLQEDL